VNSDPQGADIYVDDKFVGNTPSTLELTQGNHAMRVEASGYEPWVRELQVGAGNEVDTSAETEIEEMRPCTPIGDTVPKCPFVETSRYVQRQQSFARQLRRSLATVIADRHPFRCCLLFFGFLNEASVTLHSSIL
jgi:hypothetical protein